jgi:hypothetical protein
MNRVRIHDSSKTIADIELERALRYKNLPCDERLQELFDLINLTVTLNNGAPIKLPQGKGVVLKKLS